MRRRGADRGLGVDLVRNADRPVSSGMSSAPGTVGPDADLNAVLTLLASDDPNVNRVPVVEADETLVGLIARQDVIRAIRDARDDGHDAT